MRTRWATLRRLLAARRDPARLGDAAVLHSALLGVRMTAAADARVHALVTRDPAATLRPHVDLAALRQLPPTSFGHVFATFCADNKISPVAISAHITDAELATMTAVVRYIATHDMFHVLLGYDTSLPDELGVSGFVLGQRILRGAWLLFTLQCLLVLLARPHRAPRTLARLREGYRRGRQAPMLLAQPLEACFAEDLESLRTRLGLQPASP
mgnify:CR=1 FL=1